MDHRRASPSLDLTAVDIRRFAAFNGNNQWLHDRVGEVLGLHYAVPWPNRELTTARPFRRSPAYHLLKQANAGFGSKMGWERANFFAPRGESPDIEYGWGQQNWQPWSNAEQRAARTAVALFDQTSFSKYLLTGPDAERALQWLCTADVAVPPGRTVYTGMLNAHGTYEADITVTRLSAEEFLLVSSSASTERDQDHITRRMPAGLHASLVDVTSQYAVYGVMGPRSRDLLGRLSRADLGDEPFPFGTSQLIDLGYATVRATRITYVGELGWELYVPAEFAVGAYEDLVAAGDGLGLVNAGYYAIESLRLEKAYRAFGRELTPDYNPVKAGLLFACKLKTDIGFLGREAVERARAAGPRRRLVSLVVADPEAMIWGGELVLRDGVAVGQVTSGAWGETLGGCVALAYVRHPAGEVLTPNLVRAGEYQVNVGGRLYPAAVSLRPLVRPRGRPGPGPLRTLEPHEAVAVRPEEPDDDRQRGDGGRVPGRLVVHQHDGVAERAAFLFGEPDDAIDPERRTRAVRHPVLRVDRPQPHRGPGRRGQARGHVHDHLHVGDDGPAEGLRALPRQLPADARHVARRSASCAATRRSTSSSPSPTPSPCSSSCCPSTSATRSRTSAGTRTRSSPSCRRSSRPTCRASRGSSRRSTRSSWPPSPRRSRPR